MHRVMSDRDESRRRDWIALAMIGAVALGVRLFFMRDWLNYDETQHFLIAESPFWSDFLREARLRAHPPLAYLVMKPFVLLSSGVYWVRAVPMLAGLASIGIAFALLRRAFGSFWTAALGAFAIGLLPLFVQQSIVVRQYSLSLVFVWLALYLAVGIARDEAAGVLRLRDHALLAAAQLGALMTEYTAVLTVIPLSLVIYWPLGLRLLGEARQGQEGRGRQLITLAGFQAAAALPVLLLFRWHFQASVPHFPHTEGDTFLAGLDQGLGPMLSYFAARIPRYVDGLLPHPWGIALLGLAWLPLTPLFGGHRYARLARAAALVSLLGVGVLAALAAAGALPLGGMPRHSVSLVPGFAFAAIASCAIALDKWTSPGIMRAALAVGILAIALPGFAKGWDRLSSHRNSFYQLSARARVPEYHQAPAPIVCNNRARSLLSWYFFSDQAPRRVSQARFLDHFDYGGVTVVQTPIDKLMLDSVIQLAHDHGEVWVLYSALDLEALKKTYAFLKVGVRDSRDVRMRYSDLNTRFVLPSILAVVERSKHSRSERDTSSGRARQGVSP